MRIGQVSLEREGDLEGLAATVSWEDSGRAPVRLQVCVPSSLAWEFPVQPDAFLTACLLPAVRHGERRIRVDGDVCPDLLTGLETAAQMMGHWYGARPVPTLEAATRGAEPLVHRPRDAAMFLSGGVDSLASLRANRLRFQPSHEGYVRWGLFVHGFDIGYKGPDASTLGAFDRAIEALAPVAQDAGVHLVPVFTNLRKLEDDVDFWVYQFHGAALASVAHALSSRIRTASIAATADLANLGPWGSHPALDHYYGSAALRINHDQVGLSRFAKTRLLADWPVALDSLRVCTHVPSDRLNCGRCEKCLRTMTALVALGALGRAGAFQDDDVVAEYFSPIELYSGYTASCYRELIGPLKAVGRQDLASVLTRKLSSFDRRQRVKAWDQRYLGGAVARVRRMLKARPTP
jgi:hypothetical protein